MTSLLSITNVLSSPLHLSAKNSCMNSKPHTIIKHNSNIELYKSEHLESNIAVGNELFDKSETNAEKNFELFTTLNYSRPLESSATTTTTTTTLNSIFEENKLKFSKNFNNLFNPYYYPQQARYNHEYNSYYNENERLPFKFSQTTLPSTFLSNSHKFSPSFFPTLTHPFNTPNLSYKDTSRLGFTLEQVACVCEVSHFLNLMSS